MTTPSSQISFSDLARHFGDKIGGSISLSEYASGGNNVSINHPTIPAGSSSQKSMSNYRSTQRYPTNFSQLVISNWDFPALETVNGTTNVVIDPTAYKHGVSFYYSDWITNSTGWAYNTQTQTYSTINRGTRSNGTTYYLFAPGPIASNSVSTSDREVVASILNPYSDYSITVTLNVQFRVATDDTVFYMVQCMNSATGVWENMTNVLSITHNTNYGGTRPDGTNWRFVTSSLPLTMLQRLYTIPPQSAYYFRVLVGLFGSGEDMVAVEKITISPVNFNYHYRDTGYNIYSPTNNLAAITYDPFRNKIIDSLTKTTPLSQASSNFTMLTGGIFPYHSATRRYFSTPSQLVYPISKPVNSAGAIRVQFWLAKAESALVDAIMTLFLITNQSYLPYYINLKSPMIDVTGTTDELDTPYKIIYNGTTIQTYAPKGQYVKSIQPATTSPYFNHVVIELNYSTKAFSMWVNGQIYTTFSDAQLTSRLTTGTTFTITPLTGGDYFYYQDVVAYNISQSDLASMPTVGAELQPNEFIPFDGNYFVLN
jgi:hypothetical protein